MRTNTDILISFSHYHNIKGKLYPYPIKVLLSEISRIEPEANINNAIKGGAIERAAADLGYGLKVKRFVDDCHLGVAAEDWDDWKDHISSFYKVTLKAGTAYTVSNNVESKIVSLMKKRGIKLVEISDED